MTVSGSVVVVGAFPPPVHGSAVSIAMVAEQLNGRCDLTTLDTSPGTLRRSVGYHVIRLSRYLRSCAVLIRRLRVPNGRLYITVDAGLGIYYSIGLVALGRLLGYSVFIHHHSFAYIDKPTGRMALLARVAGPSSTHIFLCREMERRYRSHYPSATRALRVSNAWHIDPVAAPPPRHAGPLKLGHLSNLGPEKGLIDVLQTLRELLARGCKAQLVLAGPASSPETEETISAAQREFGESLDYRGAVYEGDKDRFYGDIDVFLFPTRYANEAQPYVVFEAMAFGVPSLAFSRGCLANDLSEGGGVSIATGESFPEKALPVLLDWAADREQLEAARATSLERFRSHREQAKIEFAALIAAMLDGT